MADAPAEGAYPDYAAFGLEMGPMGTWNSVVLVGGEPDETELRSAPSEDMMMARQLLPVPFEPSDGRRLRHRTDETIKAHMEVLV